MSGEEQFIAELKATIESQKGELQEAIHEAIMRTSSSADLHRVAEEIERLIRERDDELEGVRVRYYPHLALQLSVKINTRLMTHIRDLR